MPAKKRAANAAQDSLAPLVRRILADLGEDPAREGLLKTPERVAESIRFLTQGYSMDPQVVLNGATFDETVDEMVVVRDIELYSLCEHHLLPFFGRAHIGYIAQGRVLGVSKLARLVDHFSRRLQVQERLTAQVANYLQSTLQPKGVGVVLEAEHLCMSLRGVRSGGASTVTSALKGLVRDDPRTRSEFLSLAGTSG